MAHRFLLIGRGRLARHLDHVFTQILGQSILRWNRGLPLSELEALAQTATHIGLAVSDSALNELVRGPLAGCSARLVHFSGATEIPGVASAHPLMSFGQELFANETYAHIHFAVTGAGRLTDVLPGWNNPWFALAPENKALYHAWCVMGGNFPVMIWSQMEAEFKRLGIPADADRLYVRQVAENFFRQGPGALTGPLVRGDHATIEKNLQALGSSPWADLYRSFTEVHR